MASFGDGKDRNPDGTGSVGRSISRVAEGQELTPRKLEERRLIHRNDSVRRHADAFREIRTRLLELGGTRNFITLVAPIGHGGGGSFVARNLAAAFAFDESKTALLIDCDLHHPSQHLALEVKPVNGGLVDYLDQVDADLETVIYPVGVPRLRLMPAGGQRETGGEYFSSLRMRTMLDSLRSRYTDRYIVLDGPAAQHSPDARILADLADFVVLVAGYGQVTAQAVEKTVARFDPDKLAGVVFNHRL
jgi:Mrp family chromosome partitioning ATPase